MCQLCRRDCSFITLTSDQAVRYNETHAVNIEIKYLLKRKGFNIDSKSLFLLELQDVKRITLYNLTPIVESRHVPPQICGVQVI